MTDRLLLGIAMSVGVAAICGTQVSYSQADSEDTLIAQTKSEPNNPLPYARLGLLHAKRSEYPDAIAFYRKAMALNPELPGLRLNLGLAEFKSGDYRPTIDTLTPLLKSTTDAPRVNVLLGMSHYGLGEYGEAVPLLEKARDSEPANLSLLLTLAHSCLLSKQYDCVLDSYHRMIALNAESAEADILVGETLDEMHETAGAIEKFRAAVKANPKEPNAHFGLGYLLWTQVQYKEAAGEFETELANTPGYDKAKLYLADCYLQLSEFEKATQLLEKVVAGNEKNEMAHTDLAIAYAGQQRNEDALREFKVAEVLKPDDVNVHMRLGRLYRSMGRVTEATAEFDAAKGLSYNTNASLLSVMSAETSKSSEKK